jgi:lysophospholipid acyltransferase (LPLAT)-like uncharacterized protein
MPKPTAFTWKGRLLVQAVARFITLTGYTVRVQWIQPEILQDFRRLQKPYILCAWHQDIYFSAWLLRNHNLTAMISSSRDGEYIFQVLRQFGFDAARGSSTRGGLGAMKQLIRCVRQGTPVAITPDGPQGPPHEAQEGIVALARSTGAPILPWRYEAQACWQLDSWDQHKIPKPFTRIVTGVGEPIYIPADTPTDAFPNYCRQLEDAMQRVLPT